MSVRSVPASSLHPTGLYRRLGHGSRNTSPGRLALLVGNQGGVTLVELIVTVGILSLTTAFSVAYIDTDRLDLKITAQTISGHLRVARSNALTRGAHYRVSFAADSYTVERLQDNDGDGIWLPEQIVASYDVVDSISLSSSDDGVIEFSTRGLVSPPPGQVAASLEDLTIYDADTEEYSVLQIWPSGQIMEQ